MTLDDTETQKQLTETNSRYDNLLQQVTNYIDDLNLNKQYIDKDDRVVSRLDWVTNMAATLQQRKPVARDIESLELEIAQLEVCNSKHDNP